MDNCGRFILLLSMSIEFNMLYCPFLLSKTAVGSYIVLYLLQFFLLVVCVLSVIASTVAMQAAVHVNVGSLVWLEDPEVAWIDGEVIELDGKNAKISCTSGKTVITRYWCIILVLEEKCLR